MATHPVDAIISGEMDSLKKLRPHAEKVVTWLKDSLPQAHDNKALKKRIKLVLGSPRFAPNLAHLGLWEDLIQDCRVKALALGQDMQKYFMDNDLGTALGDKVIANVFGRFKVGENGHRDVVPCNKDEGVRRQDGAMPTSFPQNPGYSQLWSEMCFIHCIRMIAMGIDAMFQKLVGEVCQSTNGTFKGCAIKGFVRMLNKCISHADHYWEGYPRPALNTDLNRNACTFKTPNDLLAFIKKMKEHLSIGSDPVRIKNMFLFDEEQAGEQFFYRTVMINWLYTPGITYGELAEQAAGVWDVYYNFQSVDGFGDKDPSESWGTWRKQIEVARAYLMSPDIQDKPVQFIVETQLLLQPYLQGRCKMHLLYKIARADNPSALHSDFRAAIQTETRSYDEVQDDERNSAETLVAETSDVNQHQEGGATRLWKAAEQGHPMAVRELLQHPNIDPNKLHKHIHTTPLYIAAYRGHEEVVKALVDPRNIQINLGNTDTGMSPLIAAAQEGREEVVNLLLESNGIDVDHCTKEGVNSLCIACNQGHEHIVDILLTKCPQINVNHALIDGATAMSIAASHGYTKIIETLATRSHAGSSAMGGFPTRELFESKLQHRKAVLAWAKEATCSEGLLPQTPGGRAL
jgi:ankyrin repeat protein